MFKTEGVFDLGRDAAFYSEANFKPNHTGAVLTAYPTEAMRAQKDDSLYFIYETDTGYRLFLFFEREGDSLYMKGFPVAVKKLLSFEDFSSVKAGTNIDEVAQLDPVAGLHKKQFLDVWELDYAGAEYLAKHGHPCASIHYLKDGILKIEYEMLEDRSIVVSDMVISRDHSLRDANGDVVDHTINDRDLPA